MPGEQVTTERAAGTLSVLFQSDAFSQIVYSFFFLSVGTHPPKGTTNFACVLLNINGRLIEDTALTAYKLTANKPYLGDFEFSFMQKL